MRTCIRCGAEMKEGCALRQTDSAAGVMLTDSERFFSKGIGRVRAAVCLRCGEVSTYVDMEEVRAYLEKHGI